MKRFHSGMTQEGKSLAPPLPTRYVGRLPMRSHHYKLNMTWTGNRGEGTSGYRRYARSYTLRASDKPVLQGSADAAFLGDAQCWNPEELFLAALASCHMLWYLHLCAEAGLVVVTYIDHIQGEMALEKEGSGRFLSAHLEPKADITDPSQTGLARDLHAKAHRFCFLANSVNFPIHIAPHFEAITPDGRNASEGQA